MDEPFKSLDYTLVIKMIKQLIKMWGNNKNSILFITHDIDEALLLGNKIIVLSNKPTKILKKIDIKTEQQKRKLNDKILVDTRNEIIDLLFETNDKGVN
jgi:NitT/TauT family transport system ATP-binding protein